MCGIPENHPWRDPTMSVKVDSNYLYINSYAFKWSQNKKSLPSQTWKWMLGILSFPLGIWDDGLFLGTYLLGSGRVVSNWEKFHSLDFPKFVWFSSSTWRRKIRRSHAMLRPWKVLLFRPRKVGKCGQNPLPFGWCEGLQWFTKPKWSKMCGHL